MEHDRQADELEAEAERMEAEGERVEKQIDRTRSDWHSKQADSSVPGAVEGDGGESDEEAEPGQESDRSD